MLFSRPQAVTQLACKSESPEIKKNMNLKRSLLEQEAKKWVVSSCLRMTRKSLKKKGNAAEPEGGDN